jgi:PAS domain-containing protein
VREDAVTTIGERAAAREDPRRQITWTLRAGTYVAVPRTRSGCPEALDEGGTDAPTPPDEGRAHSMAEQVAKAWIALQGTASRSGPAQAALWHWDLATDRVEWDGGLKAQFGHEEEATDAAWRRNLIHPDDRDRVETSLQRATLTHHDAAWSERYRLHQADGSYALVSERAYVLHDDDGPRGVVGAITRRSAVEGSAPASHRNRPRAAASSRERISE